MEEFKIEYFKRDYGTEFPLFSHLSESESLMIRNQLYDIYGIGNILNLFEDISINQKILGGINAMENFKLIETLKNLKIQSLDKIFINWYRYDNIDSMNLHDLDTYFYDIWFAGPDDIDIFDTNLNWIISIQHEGFVNYVIK